MDPLFVCFVTFTSTLSHSVVWNQSMAQMSVNKKITWLNQCVCHVILVEELW